MSDPMHTALETCTQAIERAAAGRKVRLLAVSKAQPAERVRTLAAAGQHEFGENYVQEAVEKIDACADLDLCWHFIGPLQSNKCREVARRFAWLHSLDRAKLVPILARYRADTQPPLQVLIQVNIEDEAGKAGCRPEQVPMLADLVAMQPHLRLRGLMAIPMPHPDQAQRRTAFAALRKLFEQLQDRHPGIDTLSMGMSDDFLDAIAEGSTLVRIGSALFGRRAPRQ